MISNSPDINFFTLFVNCSTDYIQTRATADAAKDTYIEVLRGQRPATEDQLWQAAFMSTEKGTQASAAKEVLDKAEKAANEAEAAVKAFLAGDSEGK